MVGTGGESEMVLLPHLGLNSKLLLYTFIVVFFCTYSFFCTYCFVLTYVRKRENYKTVHYSDMR